MAASGERIRVFIAVGVSGEAREALAEVAGRLRGRLPEGVQWARLEGLHLTLKFLGNISPRMAGPLAELLAGPGARGGPPSGWDSQAWGCFPTRGGPGCCGSAWKAT